MNAQCSSRSGLSLVEVLISIGVMSIGILGAAALLPIGGAEIAEATRLERGASIGRAVYRDSLVRGLLRQDSFVNPAAAAAPTIAGGSVCIDPLFWATNIASNYNGGDFNALQMFPTKLASDTADPSDTAPRMQRLSLKSLGPGGVMSFAEADSLFRWRDDLVFQPYDEDEFTSLSLLPGRPRQLFSNTGSRQYAGDYTWMVTLTPARGEDPYPTVARQYYTASFVVFNKRDYVAPAQNPAERANPPSERLLLARFHAPAGNALGGGSASLMLPQDPQLAADPDGSDFPRIRPNQWILMAGWTRTPTPSQSPSFDPNNPGQDRPTFKWFKIASINNAPTYLNEATPNGPGWMQTVSLVGPDWDMNVARGNLNDPNPANHYLYAIVVNGVVGVVEKTIQLD